MRYNIDEFEEAQYQLSRVCYALESAVWSRQEADNGFYENACDYMEDTLLYLKELL